MKNCLICGAKLKKFGQKKDFVIFKCVNCGFGVTANDVKQQGDYHRDETYIIEEKLFKNIFNKRVKKIIKFLKKGKALEIGCSTGLMLSLLKNKGWEVMGIEVSKKAAQKAEERGINVIVNTFEKAQIKERFDLIILNHTLEHLENPRDILKKARLLLKPKGYIYIDLPNFGGVSANIFKTRWKLLLPEEHMWHFTLKSLKKLLNDLDFKLVYVNRSSGLLDVGNPLLEIYHSLFGLKKRFFNNILTLLPSLVVSKMGKGSDLMVIARKR